MDLKGYPPSILKEIDLYYGDIQEYTRVNAREQVSEAVFELVDLLHVLVEHLDMMRKVKEMLDGMKEDKNKENKPRPKVAPPPVAATPLYDPFKFELNQKLYSEAAKFDKSMKEK